VWAQGAIAQARKDGYTESLLGRRRYLPNIADSYDDKRRRHDEKVALNHPVQSLASDLMLNSVVEMHRELPDDARVIATVHDSALILAPAEKADRIAKEAKTIMEFFTPNMLEKRFGFTLGVPLVADVTINTHWRK
jgi:DNA polymerase I